MSPRLTNRFIIAVAAGLALGGCSHRDNNGVAAHEDHGWGDAPDSSAVAQAAASVPETPLGAGDIRIVSTDSSVEMSLIGEHIATRLGPKVIAQMDRDLAKDTSDRHDGALGAMIAGAVKGTVRSALTRDYGFPLSDVRDVRYENGAIVFDWKSKPTMNPETMKVNDRKFLESFSPDDARRFVAAVRTRLQRT